MPPQTQQRKRRHDPSVPATPTTGFDPDELIDVMPYARNSVARFEVK
mgnify:CR=1 FL=1